ncbi:hypothetical protein BDE02_06G236900 [Populus trichocarpa]|nr:hypothetical protein BDE02_06G236900 [Populus trichocarpa]
METYLCSGGRRRRRWRGGCFLLFPGVAPLSFGLFFFCRHEMVAPPFFFPSQLCLFAFFYLLCVREESFWSVLSNSPALDKYYDGKGPGTGGWLDPSFLGFFALFLLWFCLCFCSGFPLFFWVFLPCFCLRSSLPASVFFPGSWPVRPSLFSGFFLWVLLEFHPWFSVQSPLFSSLVPGLPPPPPSVLFLPLPFIRPESFKNRLLHDRDRGRRHGHDGFDFVADFPASLLNRSSTSR